MINVTSDINIHIDIFIDIQLYLHIYFIIISDNVQNYGSLKGFLETILFFQKFKASQ